MSILLRTVQFATEDEDVDDIDVDGFDGSVPSTFRVKSCEMEQKILISIKMIIEIFDFSNENQEKSLENVIETIRVI